MAYKNNSTDFMDEIMRELEVSDILLMIDIDFKVYRKIHR